MRILINIQGGVVQAVCTDSSKTLEVLVIDYDGEGVLVPQSENPSDTAKADIFTMETVEIDKHLVPFFDSIIESKGNFAIEVKNDDGKELWGPYDSEELARQVGDAFVVDNGTWKVIPATSEMKFDGRPE